MSENPAPASRPRVYRTRFFVASLWSALVPVSLLAAGCLLIVMYPAENKLIGSLRHGAGVALILVPFIYTGLVIVAYGGVRLLYRINRLSRVTVLILCGLGALAGAGLLAWATTAIKVVALNLFLVFAVVLLVVFALTFACAGLVWWRVATRMPPPYVPRAKPRRSRARRERAGEPEV